MNAPYVDRGRLAEGVARLGLEPLREAAGETPTYLVGGAVRDLLLGREPGDVDVAVEGDAIELAERVAALEGELRSHPSFGTATLSLGGRAIDLAGTRAESYELPGALPTVKPAALAEDLERRDFTINALAVPLAEPGRLIDHHGGAADVEAGRLRVLHRRSFTDDPTRALRAARYAARFDFDLDQETEDLVRNADLQTASAERVEAELLRILAEPRWRRGFELLGRWGQAQGGDLNLIDAVRALLGRPPWAGSAPEPQTALLAGAPSVGRYAPPAEPMHAARALVATEPGPPSRLALAARGVSPASLVLARALGAEWLDTFMEEWREVRLEIDGEDLLGVGVEQGPAIGRGLAAALAARLDGEAGERERQLAVALAAARGHE